ncbi:MAG: UDP-N-acetylmuramoyl-L-alanine--D-glutamate ligase [Proteobacteria bacterium]|nr:UDP-N-acetylmuramoyl-L-alanine--D-glutamate ligase [Pseudomonadota bacterium]
MQPTTFLFEQYSFDATTGELRLRYAYDNGISFEEVITFKPPFSDYDDGELDSLFRLLFLLSGVSYYKAYVPPRLECKAFPLDAATARWMEKVYKNGLGEFAFKNGLDLQDRVHFVAGAEHTPKIHSAARRHNDKKILVPVGGGKDSVVTLEALRQAGFDVTCFALGGAAGAATPIADCIRVSGLPSIYVSRVISPSLIDLNKTGVYNGHVPITAILSAIALVAAVLYGYRAVVMSNEHSANAPNIKIGDIEINHQYSKSFGFEQDMAQYVREHVAPDLLYFSLLRPLGEIDIARRFAKLESYHGVFRSCNTAFRQDALLRGKHWCCNCPKCRFVFLALAPFMNKDRLTSVFGQNMLDDATQTEGFAELCGVSAYKPFECVGELEESAAVIQALSRNTAWKNTRVVQALAPKINASSLESLFVRHKDHAVPDAFLPALGFDDAKIVIWGTGKEGQAANSFIKERWKPQSITFVDEVSQADKTVITEAQQLRSAIKNADVVVKSPGVSLYHPLLREAHVTTLLNLWWPYKPEGKTICITGTKGKSTTSALLGHVLKGLGYKTVVLGNIGVPVTEAPSGMDYLVLEMSSYQTANFEGMCDVAAVTSLYPEHLNWHGDLKRYYRDKLNLLNHARLKIVHPQVIEAGYEAQEDVVVCEDAQAVPNDYLGRPHNLANVGVVLAIITSLGLDAQKALEVMRDFKGLPHRQQELGERQGILFVDDSIATTPQAAIAAMEVYAGRPVTLIAGGYDRGIDYEPIVEYISKKPIHAVVALGPSGQRIADGLALRGGRRAVPATNMDEAMAAALKLTPAGGVILLSPAAPSFGLFKDYIERGHAFAKAAGF